MSEEEDVLEPFKRATLATMRALSGNDELDVSFGPGAPVARGNQVRVPLPEIGCSEEELNSVRGVGDEFALRMRYHDRVIHDRCSPDSGAAQEMFQWIEDAGQILRNKEGSDAMFGTAVNYVNFVCEDPKGQCKVTGISYS